MGNYVLSERAARALIPLIRGKAASSSPGYAPAAVSLDAFPAPFTVRWSQSEDSGSGAWVIWLPDLAKLVQLDGVYLTLTGVTAATRLPAGWYTINDDDGEATEVYCNVHKPTGSGSPSANISVDADTATTGENVIPVLVARMVTTSSGAKLVRQFVDSALVMAGGGDTTLTPDDISTELIPPYPSQDGVERGADDPPVGNEGELQIKGFKTGSPVSAYTIAQDLLDTTHGADRAIIRTPQGALEYKPIGNCAHTISVNNVAIQGVIVLSNQDVNIPVDVGAKVTDNVIPPADDDSNGAVGDSSLAARANHKHPYGPNYVRNNAAASACNVLNAGTVIDWKDKDGNILRIYGGLNTNTHTMCYRVGTSNYNAVQLAKEPVTYEGNLPSSGVSLIIGNGSETIPVIVPSRIYVGTVSASNQTRTSLTRGTLSFKPGSTSNQGGTISFYLNGGSTQTEYIQSSSSGLEIRSYNTTADHTPGIKLNTNKNMARLEISPDTPLDAASSNPDRKAIVDAEYIINNLKTLYINGDSTDIKFLATSDLYLTIPSTPTGYSYQDITVVTDVEYDASAHTFKKKTRTIRAFVPNGGAETTSNVFVAVPHVGA